MKLELLINGVDQQNWTLTNLTWKGCIMKKSIRFLYLIPFFFLLFNHSVSAWNQSKTSCVSVECTSGWAPLDTPYGGGNISAIAARSNSFIVVANDSGIYCGNPTSTYAAYDWKYLINAQATSLAASIDSAHADTTIYAGTLGSGLMKIRMRTSTFRCPANGGNGISLTPLFVWPLAGENWFNLQIATDTTFSQPVLSSISVTPSYRPKSTVLAPLTEYYWRVLNNYKSSTDIWSFTTACSTCAGTTLNSPPDSVIISSTGLNDKYVRALATDSKGVVYAVSSSILDSNYTVSRSADSGSSWTNLGNPLSVSHVSMTSLAVDFGGRVLVGTDNGLFCYAGNKWDSISISQVTDKHINAVCVDANNHLYLGTNNGLYFSQDSGITWNLFVIWLLSGGLNTPSKITALAPLTGQMYPFVGSNIGIYQYIALVSVDHQVRHATVGFSLRHSLHFVTSGSPELVDVSVFDSRGVEKAHVFHEVVSRGAHEVRMNNGILLPGVYYVKVKIGSSEESKTMIITK
jgi:hypothetical protein